MGSGDRGTQGQPGSAEEKREELLAEARPSPAWALVTLSLPLTPENDIHRAMWILTQRSHPSTIAPIGAMPKPVMLSYIMTQILLHRMALQMEPNQNQMADRFVL